MSIVISGFSLSGFLNRALGNIRHRYAIRETDHVTRKLRRSVKVRGLWGTLNLCIAVLLQPSLRRYRDKGPSDFDLQFGVDTASWVPINEVDIEDRLRVNAVGYQPTPPEVFHEVMSSLRIRHKLFTFVDLGCGKGLTLLLASGYPFKKIVGVEFSPTLSRVAKENIRIYRERARNYKDIQVLCCDARFYEFPHDPLVVYLNNPFTGEVLTTVHANLVAAKDKHSQDIFVIYVAASEKEVFGSSKSLKQGFTIVPPGSPSCPTGFAADYCIYAL